MSKVKDYFGEKFLNKEQNIKLDFIEAILDDPYDKHPKGLEWVLTINTGLTDDKGYIDALIIEISLAQYPSFDNLKVSDFDLLEYKTVQVPQEMTKVDAHKLVCENSQAIYNAITDFENED